MRLNHTWHLCVCVCVFLSVCLYVMRPFASLGCVLDYLFAFRYSSCRNSRGPQQKSAHESASTIPASRRIHSTCLALAQLRVLGVPLSYRHEHLSSRRVRMQYVFDVLAHVVPRSLEHPSLTPQLSPSCLISTGDSKSSALAGRRTRGQRRGWRQRTLGEPVAAPSVAVP